MLPFRIEALLDLSRVAYLTDSQAVFEEPVSLVAKSPGGFPDLYPESAWGREGLTGEVLYGESRFEAYDDRELWDTLIVL